MQGLYIFSKHIFQSKIRLSMKTSFHVHIGTVKFATQFKESPCSQVVTFPSFGSEGHGVSPHRGTPFFSDFCWTPFFFVQSFFFLSTELEMKRHFKREQQTKPV